MLEVSEIFAILAVIITGVSLGPIPHYREALRNRQSKAFRRLRASLRKGSTTGLIYASVMRWLMEHVDRFFEGTPYKPDFDIKPESATGRWARRLFRRPLDYQRWAEVRGKNWQAPAWSTASYDRCLLLAIFYPAIFILLSWLLAGDAGRFGQVAQLANNGNTAYRILVGGILFAICSTMIVAIKFNGWKSTLSAFICGFLMLVSTDLAQWIFDKPDVRALGFAIGGAYVLTVAFLFSKYSAWPFPGAFAVGNVLACAAVYAVAVKITIEYDVEFYFAGLFALIMVGFTASICGFAIKFGIRIANILNRSEVIVAVISILYLSAEYLLSNILVIPGTSNEHLTLLVGCIVLPVLNAPFDWLSIGLTRHLLRLGLRRKRLLDRFLCWWADISGAILLLIGVAVGMVVALEAVNGIGGASGMLVPIVPVAATLADIGSEPDAARHLWIYFALFSTLIPTIVHLVVMIFSGLTANFPPMQRLVVNLIQSGPDAGYNNLIAFLLCLRWVFAVGTTSLFVYAIYWAGSEVADVWKKLLWLLIEVQKVSQAVFVG
ncbi:MAG: hypothetical protein P1U37_17305 [Minwuia sp.]|nr:hypothetical protein [Minwuia sp.]